MALLKPFQTPQGVTATYHRILKADIDCNTQTINITTAVFATPEARAAGFGQLWHEYVSVQFSDLTQDPRDLLYPLLAAFGGSYLRGGEPSEEGFARPGDNTISLTPGAMTVRAPTVAP